MIALSEVSVQSLFDVLLRVAVSGTRSERRDVAAVFLGLCGLRFAEVQRLRVRDLDVAAGLVHVMSCKGGVPREVRITKGLAGMILQVRAMFADSRYGQRLFVSERGSQLRYCVVAKHLAEWTQAAVGRVYTFHCLRHSAAVRRYLSSRDVFSVQRLLGHRSLRWTAAYLRSAEPAPDPALPDVLGAFAAVGEVSGAGGVSAVGEGSGVGEVSGVAEARPVVVGDPFHDRVAPAVCGELFTVLDVLPFVGVPSWRVGGS